MVVVFCGGRRKRMKGRKSWFNFNSISKIIYEYHNMNIFCYIGVIYLDYRHFQGFFLSLLYQKFLFFRLESIKSTRIAFQECFEFSIQKISSNGTNLSPFPAKHLLGRWFSFFKSGIRSCSFEGIHLETHFSLLPKQLVNSCFWFP